MDGWIDGGNDTHYEIIGVDEQNLARNMSRNSCYQRAVLVLNRKSLHIFILGVYNVTREKTSKIYLADSMACIYQ